MIAHILAIILLLASSAFGAGSWPIPGGKVYSSGGGGDTCTGGLLFSWHAESTTVTSGTPAGCSIGDTTATANSSVSLATAYYSDGTHSIYSISPDDYYTFTPSSGDIILTSAGTITFDFYLPSTPQSMTVLFEAMNSSGQKITIGMYNTADFRIRYAGATDTAAITTTASLTTGQWYTATARWDVSGATNKLSINVNSASAVSTASITQHSSDYTTAKWGVINSYASYAYIDNMKIYNSWL